MVKKLYKACFDRVEGLPQQLDRQKTKFAEKAAIRRKKPLYSQVQWSQEQQQEFDTYWKSVYGKPISNRWHRLYQCFNGTFRVDYFPEMLYSTVVEPALNDWRYARILEDKSLVEPLFGGGGAVIPETVCLCSGGVLLDASRRPISRKRAEELASGADGAVLKPTVGSSSGKDVFFLAGGDGSKEILEQALSRGMRDFIIQRRIVSHPELARFHPSSVNTLRITTCLIRDGIFHAPVAFRIGRGGKDIDNIHAGGIGVGVRDNGDLLDTAYELGYGDKPVRHQVHPDSGLPFKGAQLPGISAVVETAERLHGRLPHIGIVSWDFTVDEAGQPVLIEANLRGQGVWFPQIIHGAGLFGDRTGAVLRQVQGKTI